MTLPVKETGRVKKLDPEVARKIAAGEVIDKPCAIVRELMDNAIDSKANRIKVEIKGGGIEKIRVIDNGCGMSKEDLYQCARPHATSKISTEKDLLSLSTLGFRGEALSSMAAVSNLEITSGGFRMRASVTEDHIISQFQITEGTIVQTSGLFENFPARRQFLKRASAEGNMCKNTFIEKSLPRPDITFSFMSDGEEKLFLSECKTLKERFIHTTGMFDKEDLFYEVHNENERENFSFSIIIGEPSIFRPSRKDISIYVNGRKIQEYSLVQALVYGCQGYFPNGTFPVATLFVEIDPSLVDFNIHPAKKEARFKDINPLHHAVSESVKNFFKTYSKTSIVLDPFPPPESKELNFAQIYAKKALDIASPSLLENKSFGSKNFLPYTLKYSNTIPRGKPIGFPLEEKESFSDKNITKKKYIEEKESLREDESLSCLKENENPSSEENFHFVGSALGTFLIAEKNNTLYIIDQHAAHERMIYNKIMAESKQKQALLVPYVLQTERVADDNYIRTIKTKLEEAGFDCSDCGKGKWIFSSVPARWKGTEEDLKKDVLDRRCNPTDMINSVASATACRSAVMDGTFLDRETAKKIAFEALNLSDPHCPHGRPIYTAITRKQLFELVKRT